MEMLRELWLPEKTTLLWAMAPVLAVLGGLYMVLLVWPSPRTYRLIQKVKGPPGHFLTGNAVELASLPHEDLLLWFDKQSKVFGKRMRLWVVGSYHIYTRDPSDAQVVLSGMHHITKGWEYLPICEWLEDGLLTSTGTKWQQRRKVLTPAFHFKILEDNLATINNNSKVLAEKFAFVSGKAVEVDDYIPYCTLDVIAETAMGLHINSQGDRSQKYVVDIKRVTEMIVKRIRTFWMYNRFYYFTKYGIDFWLTRRSLQKFSNKVIDERRRQYVRKQSSQAERKGKVRYAFLDLLLEIEAQNPGVFSGKDVREEVDTFMFEGHDTTSTAFTYIFFNLAANPDVQEEVYKEQTSIFGDSDRDVTLTDLNKMTYLEKVIKESLRMFPSVPYMSRRLDHDITLEDGTLVPGGTNVVIQVYLLHHNEEYWPDPEKFDPERFSEEEVQGRHPYAYIPFSAGPRNCIGQKFAMMELKTTVSTVIRKLKILPVTKREDFKVTLSLILRPNKPIELKFLTRQ